MLQNFVVVMLKNKKKQTKKHKKQKKLAGHFHVWHLNLMTNLNGFNVASAKIGFT